MGSSHQTILENTHIHQRGWRNRYFQTQCSIFPLLTVCFSAWTNVMTSYFADLQFSIFLLLLGLHGWMTWREGAWTPRWLATTLPLSAPSTTSRTSSTASALSLFPASSLSSPSFSPQLFSGDEDRD